MDWREEIGVDFVWGLAGNAALHALAHKADDDLNVRHFCEFDCAADSRRRKRRVVARLEETTRDFVARYIVTSLDGEPSVYDTKTANPRRLRASPVSATTGAMTGTITIPQRPLTTLLSLCATVKSRGGAGQRGTSLPRLRSLWRPRSAGRGT